MRAFYSILFLLVIGLRPLCFVMQLTYFQTNKVFLVENMCSNRDMPELNCQATCYLVKQFDKINGEEDGSNRDLLILSQAMTLLFFENNTALSFDLFDLKLIEQTNNFKNYVDPYGFLTEFKLLRPPRV